MKYRNEFFCWNWPLLLLAAICLIPLPSAAQNLFPSGSSWKYFKGRSEASAPDQALWRTVSFSDSNWDEGESPFFYGEAYPSGTEIPDMRNNYSTLFLRKVIQVDEDPGRWSRVTIRSRVDDGFILWVNGKVAQRRNAPEGEPRFNQTAPSGATEPVSIIAFNLTNPSQFFQQGANVISVMVFNVALTSSDLVFDMEMDVFQPDQIPPQILSITPQPGRVDSLSEITVVFNEPVQGVDRQDLMLNEFPATDLVAEDDRRTYRFLMPSSATSSAVVKWDPDHGITDLSPTPNAFDVTQTGAPYIYRIQDLTPPKLSSIHPTPGTTLSQLQRITVMFDEPVSGVNPDDLLTNGSPALNVTGEGTGPYVFDLSPDSFTQGMVSIDFGADVTDPIIDQSDDANAFSPLSWSYQVDRDMELPDLVISEIHAVNLNGLTDEDGDSEDWVEIWNRGNSPVRLLGWSLTDDPQQPTQWSFPDVSLPANNRLIVFASGKNRKPSGAAAQLHTNFKLGAGGETLLLLNAEDPPKIVNALDFPEQRPDISYGYINDGDTLGYFQDPSPGQPNRNGSFLGIWNPPAFSAERGFYDNPVQVYLSSEEGSLVRYTLDGSEPTRSNGISYESPISIQSNTILRAAAFSRNTNDARLPSQVETHTYIYRSNSRIKSLPVISLVTDRSNLFGRTGIMETNPRNTVNRGIQWERPVSAEWIQADGQLGFQVNCGLRVQGGNYVRERYSPNGGLPFSKYSFRLYFRGEYGPGRLNFPFLGENEPVQDFDTISLRAGMNDHTNPYISDELVRRMFHSMGNVSSRGRFAHLFLNGEYKGYYNPAERIDGDFLQSWWGGTDEWDIIAQFGELREGDTRTWNLLIRTISQMVASDPGSYDEVNELLDLENFIDYLLLNSFVATGDWPHNNWRIARQRTTGDTGKFRYIPWDAEWSFGFRNPITHNTFSNELNGDSDVSRFYQKLKQNPEFRLKFADRVEKHLIQPNGALHVNQLSDLFLKTHQEISSVIPRLNVSFPSWISRRPGILMTYLRREGLVSTVTSPILTPQTGRVFSGESINVTSDNEVFFTINGPDPRIPISGLVHPEAQVYSGPLQLDQNATLRLRARNNGVWSALVEAEFQIGAPASPIAISEIHYNPLGGSGYEFLELVNLGGVNVNLSNAQLKGVDYSFPVGSTLQPGQIWLIASSLNPQGFSERYPGVRVDGYFNGALSNSGETLTLIGSDGLEIFSMAYEDSNGWPAQADGERYSLTRISFQTPESDPASWAASQTLDGTPGRLESVSAPASIRISEVMADNVSAVENNGAFPDWIELWNSTDSTQDLQGWRIQDSSADHLFVFDASFTLEPDERKVVWMSNEEGLEGSTTGFALNRAGDRVVLSDESGNRVDVVSFGPQIADYSMSLDSNSEWILTRPTPTLAPVNAAVEMGEPDSIVLNEWMANPTAGETDWLELYNSGEFPVALQGFSISVNDQQRQIMEPGFIPAKGWVDWTLNDNFRPGEIALRIPAEGGSLLLRDSLGNTINEVTYPAPNEGFSQGRIPDGAPQVVTFQISPTRGAANANSLINGPFITEVLALNGTADGADWIEIYNPLDQEISMDQWSLSIGSADPGQWRFPSNLLIPSKGYIVIEASVENSPGSISIGQSLPGRGSSIYLYNPENQLSHQLDYGFQIPGRSIGSVNHSKSVFALQSALTPGQINADRADIGSPASVVINEWISYPLEGPDWIELFNSGDAPADISEILIVDSGKSVVGQGTRIPPLSYLDSRSWIRLNAGEDLNFGLDNRGESIRVYQQNGFSLISGVDFGPQPLGRSEGFYPDGSGTRIQMEFPTPGSANLLLVDSDNDGLPDPWETENGLDPTQAEDAGSDLDLDGATALEEFLAGTDPNDPSDVLKLDIHVLSGEIEIRFNAAPGKSYILETRTIGNQNAEWATIASWPTEDQVKQQSKTLILQEGATQTWFRVRIDHSNN